MVMSLPLRGQRICKTITFCQGPLGGTLLDRLAANTYHLFIQVSLHTFSAVCTVLLDIQAIKIFSKTKNKMFNATGRTNIQLGQTGLALLPS